MSEPNEPIKGLIIPNTGDLVGAWGTSAVNPNFTAIGGMFGGFQTLSLSAATTIALTGPAGSITPGAGPTQQQNALLRFTGSPSGTATIQFSLPGSYVIDNQAGTAFPLILAPAVGTGTQVGAPWWRKCRVFFDGTNVDYENPPEPGSAIDLHGVTTIPNWMTVCTKQYALIKDGSTYSTASYSGLFGVIGSTFGGNGITTFAVPDERSRMRLAVDTNPGSGFAGRVTAAGSNINGTTMGAAGGNELMQSHSHAITDPGHQHTISVVTQAAAQAQANPGLNTVNAASLQTTNTTTTGITVNSAGSGSSQNMPPAIVSFLPLIKT